MARRNAKISTEGKPWARYLRLSKAEAAEDRGKTKEQRLALTNAKLDAHLGEVTDWMDANSIPYAAEHVYRDAALSAWKPGVRRPDWEQMMELAEQGELAGIAIVAVDRFTRDVTTMEDLIRLAETTDVKIGGPRAGTLDLTTYDGIMRARGAAQQAANESLATSFRIRETLARKMKDGKPMGAGRAYGFETGGLVQVPEEVAVVREIATRLLAGEALQHLAAELNDRGLTTSRGSRWNGQNLARMLGGHRYGGLVEHHGQIVGVMKGEPVLDRDSYDAVQALLASRRRGRRPTGRFPLTGLLICSDCQRTMNGATRNQAKADGTHSREYRCPPQLGGCGRITLADQTEKIVGEHMIALLSKPENAAAILAEDQVLNEARATAQAKLQAVEDRLTDLEVKWATGELIQSAYDRAKPVLDGQRAKLLAGLDELTPAAAMGSYDAELDWHGIDTTDDDRREIIRRYRVRIEVLPFDMSRPRRFDPTRLVFS